MGAGHVFVRLQQKMPAPNFFRVGRRHIVGHVAVKRQDLEFGLGMVQMPLNALVVLAVVSPIEMNEGRAFLSIGQNEMRHRGVFDGLRHRKGLPAVAAGHGEHGIVSGKGGVVSNGQWWQELLGVVTEVPQGIKAILIHVRGIAPWYIGGDEAQFVVSCKLQQGYGANATQCPRGPGCGKLH